MTCIDKIILALVVVQVVALVLAKPYEPEYDERLYHSNEDVEDFLYKRATDCGSGDGLKGKYSKKCRSSCKSGELDLSGYQGANDPCPEGEVCCMCHSSPYWQDRYGGCDYE